MSETLVLKFQVLCLRYEVGCVTNMDLECTIGPFGTVLEAEHHARIWKDYHPDSEHDGSTFDISATVVIPVRITETQCGDFEEVSW